MDIGVTCSRSITKTMSIIHGRDDFCILKEGFVWKQSRNVLRRWKRRYVVLSRLCLLCFRRETDLQEGENPKIKLDLSDIDNIIQDSKKHSSVFELKSKKVNLKLRIPGAGQVTEWVAALQDAIVLCKTRENVQRELRRASFKRNVEENLRQKYRQGNPRRSVENIPVVTVLRRTNSLREDWWQTKPRQMYSSSPDMRTSGDVSDNANRLHFRRNFNKANQLFNKRPRSDPETNIPICTKVSNKEYPMDDARPSVQAMDTIHFRYKEMELFHTPMPDVLQGARDMVYRPTRGHDSFQDVATASPNIYERRELTQEKAVKGIRRSQSTRQPFNRSDSRYNSFCGVPINQGRHIDTQRHASKHHSFNIHRGSDQEHTYVNGGYPQASLSRTLVSDNDFPRCRSKLDHDDPVSHNPRGASRGRSISSIEPGFERRYKAAVGRIRRFQPLHMQYEDSWRNMGGGTTSESDYSLTDIDEVPPLETSYHKSETKECESK